MQQKLELQGWKGTVLGAADPALGPARATGLCHSWAPGGHSPSASCLAAQDTVWSNTASW